MTNQRTSYMAHRDGEIAKHREALELSRALVRQGWGSQDESHRQFFTSQFMPDADKDIQHSLNETQRLAAAPEMAERFLRANADADVSDQLAKITAPTLVLYPTGDLRVPYPLGQ